MKSRVVKTPLMFTCWSQTRIKEEGNCGYTRGTQSRTYQACRRTVSSADAYLLAALLIQKYRKWAIPAVSGERTLKKIYPERERRPVENKPRERWPVECRKRQRTHTHISHLYACKETKRGALLPAPQLELGSSKRTIPTKTLRTSRSNLCRTLCQIWSAQHLLKESIHCLGVIAKNHNGMQIKWVHMSPL